jgi:hypothetical protein
VHNNLFNSVYILQIDSGCQYKEKDLNGFLLEMWKQKGKHLSLQKVSKKTIKDIFKKKKKKGGKKRRRKKKGRKISCQKRKKRKTERK